LGRDRPKPRSLLYLTGVLVARTGTFSHLIDHIRPKLQSISSREPGAPNGILVVLIRLAAHRADVWKSRRARRSQGFVVDPDIPRSGGSQSCHPSDPRRSSPTRQHARSCGLPRSIVAIAITSSQTNRCWQSRGVPGRQTTSLDVLCLMSAVEPMRISRTVSDGLVGRPAALSESPAVIEFRTARTARTAHSFLKK
jgi:hypothetical protein